MHTADILSINITSIDIIIFYSNNCAANTKRVINAQQNTKRVIILHRNVHNIYYISTFNSHRIKVNVISPVYCIRNGTDCNEVRSFFTFTLLVLIIWYACCLRVYIDIYT